MEVLKKTFTETLTKLYEEKEEFKYEKVVTILYH